MDYKFSIDKTTGDKHAIKLMTEKKIKEDVLFTCDDEDFMKEFSEMLYKFYYEYNGEINIERDTDCMQKVRRQRYEA